MKIFSDDTINDHSNTMGERNELDKLLTLPLFVQGVLGQNVLHPNWKWKTKMAQQIFIMFLVIYLILGTKEYLKHATDVTSIWEANYTLVMASFFSIKYLLFINSRENFRMLYLIAKTSLLEMIRADSIEKSNEFLTKVKMVIKISFATILCPMALYLVNVIWNYILGTRVTLSKTTSILMPMTSPYYEVGLILHTSYMFVVAFTYCVVDLWFVVLTLSFCMASDSLVKMLTVESKGYNESDLEYMDRLNNTLRKFYTNHQKLMGYLSILSDMYKWPTVIPLVNFILAFCPTLLCISEQMQWIFLANLMPAITELFAYNWLGDKVKKKAAQLNMALIEFDWTSMRLKDKKNYLIIITYMNKEFSIKTALENDLSLVTMTSVFKASYRAFAVLRTMEL